MLWTYVWRRMIGKAGFPALTPGACKCWRVAPEESNPFSRVIVINRELRLFPTQPPHCDRGVIATITEGTI